MIIKLNTLAYWVYRHKALAFAVFAVLSLGFGVLGFMKLQLSTDLLDLLPSDDERVAQYKETMRDFNPLNRVFFAVSHSESNKAAMQATGDELAAALGTIPEIAQVKYRWQPDEVLLTLNALKKYRSVLFSETAARDLSKRLNAKGIDDTLKFWRRTLTESPAPFLTDNFYEDPLGINRFLFKYLDKLRSFGNSMHVEQGRLFSKNQKQLLILAYPLDNMGGSVFAHKLVRSVNAKIAELNDNGSKVAWLASHRFAAYNEQQMQSDVGLASTISTVGIVLLAFLVFRRPLLTVVVMTPVIVAGLYALAFVPIMFSPLSVVAAGCGSILFGLAVDYSLHLLFHLDKADKIEKDSISAALKHLSKPVSISALTTFAAFVCLQSSTLPSYRQFGAVAAVGILAAWLYSIIFVPALASLTPVRRSSAPLRFDGLFSAVFAFVARHRPSALAGLVACSLAAIPGCFAVEFDGDLKRLYLDGGPLQQDMETVNQAFGNAMRSTTVIVEATDYQDALRGNEWLNATLSKLQRQRQIEDFYSLASFLPSAETQASNLARWRTFFDANRLAQLKQDTTKAATNHKVSMTALKPAFTSLKQKEELQLTEHSYIGTPLEELFKTQLIRHDKTKILANVRLDKQTTLEQFEKMISPPKEVSYRFVVVNAQAFVQQMIHLIHSELFRLAGLGLICVFLILCLAYGSSNSIAMLAPLLVSILWTFGIIGWLDIKINVMNCIVALLVFGLVVDYSVFLTAAARANDRAYLERSSAAILVSALTTFIAVGALALASHPALKAVGVTILIGISCGFVAVLTVVPVVAFAPSSTP